MSIVADPGSETVRLLEVGGEERTLRPAMRTPAGLRGELVSETTRKLPEAEWLTEKNARQPSSMFDLECSIVVPGGARGKVLLLVEFPGRRHHANRCSAEVNGQSAAVVEKSSAGHIGYLVSSAGNFWKDARAYESEWSWHICEVPAGPSRVRFHGAAAHPSPKLGVWLWTEQDLAGSATRRIELSGSADAAVSRVSRARRHLYQAPEPGARMTVRCLARIGREAMVWRNSVT